MVNTLTLGKQLERDGFKIRRATVEHALPCLTSMDTAKEVMGVIANMRRRRLISVMAMQDFNWEV